jgi:DNA-directed RNA polymerase subunit F
VYRKHAEGNQEKVENVPEAADAVRVVVKDTADEAEELKDEVAVTLLDVAPVVVDELMAVLEIEDDVVTEETVTPALLVMELVLLDTTVLETTTVEVVVVEAVFGTSVMDG